MTRKQRRIEVFSAGCPVCQSAIAKIKGLACPSCDVHVLDMNSPDVERRAKQLGIETVPAVAIDGKLADCCSSRGVDESVLRAAGLGQSLP